MTVVAVVDDNKVDRYTVRRRLSKETSITEVLEFDAGDTFLETYFSDLCLDPASPERLVVLMDINMPRLNGFETVAGMEEHLSDGRGKDSCVVMMFSSSENPLDHERAAEFDIVKGYIVKPFARDDVSLLNEFC